MNHFSTKIANWLQSKLFTIELQRRSRRRPKLTWRLDRKNNQQHVGLIPVINGIKWYVSCLSSFSPFTKWTQWGTVMTHRLFSHRFVGSRHALAWPSFSSWSSLFHVPNLLFKFRDAENVSSKSTDAIWCQIQTKFPKNSFFLSPFRS